MVDVHEGRDASGVRTVTLGDALSAADAEAARRTLLGLLERPEPLALDLSNLSSFDSIGLQILLLMEREAARMAVPLRFHNPAPAVRDLAEVLGLQQRLGCASVYANAAAPHAREVPP